MEGSGSVLWLTDPDADLGGPKIFGSYGTGTQVISHKEVIKKFWNSRNQGFSYFFAWWWKDTDPDPYLWPTDPDPDLWPTDPDPDPQHYVWLCVADGPGPGGVLPAAAGGGGSDAAVALLPQGNRSNAVHFSARLINVVCSWYFAFLPFFQRKFARCM